jgi:hypothetical protein
MKLFNTLITLAVCLSAGLAASGQTFKQLTLKNGQTITEVVVLGYGSTSIMAKWAGGRGQLPYNELPDDLRATLEARKPAPEPKPAPIRLGEPSINDDPPAPILKGPIYSTPDPKPATAKRVAGQVFVTTKAGNNYKLGAVRVAVYPAKTVSEYTDWAFQEGRARVKHFDKLSDDHSRQKNYNLALRYAQMASKEARSLHEYLPIAQAETMTDADGRFSLEHRVAEPYYIVAVAQRQVGDEVEHYEWFVRSDLFPKSGDLLLHNGNMQ